MSSFAAWLVSPGALWWAVAVVGASLVALLIARRGRRVGDEIRCRKCGFDLTGKPATSTRCPECGSDVTATRATVRGHRVAWLRLTYLAVAVLLPAAFVASVLGYARAKQLDWRQYAPVSLLLDEADGAGGGSGDNAAATAALDELVRRGEAKTFSHDQWQAIVPVALAYQADTSKPWVPQWGRLIETAHDLNQCTDAQWADYAKNAAAALGLRLRARPTVVRGYDLPMTYDWGTPRVDRATFVVYLAVDAATVDGKTVGVYRSNDSSRDAYDGRLDVALNRGGGSYRSPYVYQNDLDGFSVGHHTAGRTLTLAVVEPKNAGSPSMTTLRGVNGYTFTGDPLATVKADIAAPFTLAEPNDPAAALTMISDEHRAGVRAAVTVKRAWREGKELRIDYVIDGPPVRVEFTPYARALGYGIGIGTEVKIDHGSWSESDSATHPGRRYRSYNGRIFAPADLPGATRFDLVLRPDLHELASSVDATPGWGEMIVIPDIEIHDGPATQPTR